MRTRMLTRGAAALAAVGALAVIGPAGAAEKTYKIAIVTYAGQDPASLPPGGGPMQIKDLLAEYGYREGTNVTYIYRSAGRSLDRMNQYAKEVVDWKPDLIVSQMTNAGVALRKATAGTNIPVIAWSTNPQEAGMINTFSRSGTNFTAFAYEPEITMRMLRILKLLKPSMKKVGHLYNETYAPAPSILRELRESAGLMGMEVTVYPTMTRAAFETSLSAMARDGMEGVVVGPHELFNTNGQAIGELAQKYKLPMVACCQASITGGGGVASFGPPSGWPAMAERADLILKGKLKPEDTATLRIQAPMVINLKAIQALGFTAPPHLIDEANRVIR